MFAPDTGDDVSLVLTAANALHSSEMGVFRAAHQHWYGEPASERTLRQYFDHYRCEGGAPLWVRHYARRTLHAMPTEAHHPSGALVGLLHALRLAS